MHCPPQMRRFAVSLDLRLAVSLSVGFKVVLLCDLKFFHTSNIKVITACPPMDIFIPMNDKYSASRGQNKMQLLSARVPLHSKHLSCSVTILQPNDITI